MSNQLTEAINKGKTVWLKNLLSEMLPNLPRETNACHLWYLQLIEAFERRRLIEPKQQKNFLTDVRNAIRVIDPLHPALDVVKFDKDTWVEINNTDTDRIAQRDTQFLSNPQQIVDRAVELINSYQWSEIAAGLAVVSGRRCTEVLKTAQFRYQTPYIVSFSGSLKRRGETTLCVFDIPTLCKAKLVIKGIERLREILGEEIEPLSPRQISGRYSRAVAKKCDEHFADIVPKRTGKDNLYTHLFRAVYATIASYWYCPPKVPEIEYRAAIQGHYQILDENNPVLRRSLAAGRNYFDYKISDGMGNIDGRLGIKLSQKEVSVVSAFNRATSLFESQIVNKLKPRTTLMSEPITIPRYLMSRLELLSQKLGTEDKDTLEALFDWAEVSLALADSLELDELKTNTLYEEVERLKESQVPISDSGSTSQISFDSQNIDDLVSSVRLLAETVAKQNKVGQYKSPKKVFSHSKALNREPDEEAYPNRTEESEDAINHAIDKVMEFNERPEVKHKDKFRVGIGCIRKLTNRGDQVIRRVIESRQSEVDAHHEKHQLSKTHNSKGREAPSIHNVITL